MPDWIVSDVGGTFSCRLGVVRRDTPYWRVSKVIVIHFELRIRMEIFDIPCPFMFLTIWNPDHPFSCAVHCLVKLKLESTVRSPNFPPHGNFAHFCRKGLLRSKRLLQKIEVWEQVYIFN
jgi:hypothetical protein